MLPFAFVDLHIDWIRVCVFFCEVSISEAKRCVAQIAGLDLDVWSRLLDWIGIRLPPRPLFLSFP